jgi:pimeloyl-ACP methyl ester carboxylesterase
MKRLLPLLLLGWLTTGRAWASQGWLDVKGVHVHYVDEGRGDPVVLIHGFASSILINWRLPGMMARLSRSHSVIAIDCRGHGLSDRPPKPEQYGMEMVEDVVRVMDALQVPRSDVVGYSMGGMIAMKLLATHPDRVRRAVVGGFGWLEPGLARAITLPQQGKPDNTLQACYQSWAHLALTPQELDSLHMPIQIVVGQDDAIVKSLYVGPLHRARPDIPITEIPKANHFSSILSPLWLAAVDDFLAARPSTLHSQYDKGRPAGVVAENRTGHGSNAVLSRR